MVKTFYLTLFNPILSGLEVFSINNKWDGTEINLDLILPDKHVSSLECSKGHNLKAGMLYDCLRVPESTSIYNWLTNGLLSVGTEKGGKESHPTPPFDHAATGSLTIYRIHKNILYT